MNKRLCKILSKWLLCILIVCLVFTGCGEGQDPGNGPGGTEQEASSNSETKAKTDKKKAEESKFVPYEAPSFKTSRFHKDKAVGDGKSYIDLSEVSKGYVGVSVKSDKRIKLQVLKGDSTYNYDVSSNGTPSIFPLQCGDGTYTFRVMENLEDTKYVCIYYVEKNVELKDKFQPFLRPNDYVNYNKKSDCVKKANELAAKEEDALGVVTSIFNYICKTVKYDFDKAANIQSGYLPDPDETMNTGKGICLDYAALAAAMMRSQGIPTKMVYGYVSPNDVYHAWNMFYTKETGWVAVKFEVKGKKWTRLDITFSDNGTDSTYIGNGENYADVYYY